MMIATNTNVAAGLFVTTIMLMSSYYVVDAALQAGDNICVEGYVMDLFCINRGTLLDAPSVVTLANPELHSFHCLIDVDSCVSSPFEVLLDPSESGQLYNRGWRLDESSKQQAVALAQNVGSCTTCNGVNTDDNAHKMGFRAVMNATIVDLNVDDASIPPTLQIHAMEDTTAFAGSTADTGASACMTYYDIVDIVDKSADDEGGDSSGSLEDGEEFALEAGDNICVEGYVMDSFCIERGTLLDAPTIVTLENPELHSIHCLIDVNSCVSSPFEVLLDPSESGELYNRGWRLDESSKQQAISLAQDGGSCTTCKEGNTDDNARKLGFRAVMNATIVDLNANDASIPPTLQIHNIEDVTAFAGSTADTGDSACMTFYGIQDIVDKAAAASSSGSGSGGSLLDGISVNANAPGASKTKLQMMYLAHGSLMMIGWGLLLPSGTLIAKFFKHRPNGLWFKLHRGIQTLGLLLALAGWIIALTNFNVFGDVGLVSYRHGICGMIVMSLGLLQPLNALLRPHAPENEDEAKSTKRLAWEIWHKSSGWFAVLLAIPTIVMGTLSLPSLEDQTKFQIGYGAGCGGALLLLVAFIFYDKKNFKQEEQTEEAKEVKEETGSA